jgi:hypothetical protein
MGEEYMANITDNFQVEGFVEQRKELEKLMMSNPAMEKKVQGLIRKVLMTARRQVSGDIKGDIKNDPRQAYKAVKSAVYRRILGGNISILSKRHAGKRGPVLPIVHKLETQLNSKGNHRGGNRMPRSRRTEDLLTYQGADRGFILRFLNAGTDVRESGVGNRGSIAPRNFFANSSQKAMEKAAEQLDTLIEDLIKKELK